MSIRVIFYGEGCRAVIKCRTNSHAEWIVKHQRDRGAKPFTNLLPKGTE